MWHFYLFLNSPLKFLYLPNYQFFLHITYHLLYIYQNMTVTENGVAYIKITDALIKEFGIDSASAGNMINNLNYVNEILVWIFLSEDVKSNVIRANIRSRGPVINEVASRYGGGGHKFASGARLADWDLADKLISSLDELTKKYIEK